MKFLLITLGSVGDILPFLAVAETLRQRRHQVIFASNAGYGPLVRASGFEFAAIWQRDQQSLDGLIGQDPAGAWAAVRRDMFVPATVPARDFIAQHAGNCVVLASWTAFGARQAHRELGVPLCNIYLSPGAVEQDDDRPADSAALRNLGLFPAWFGEPAGVQACGFPLLEDTQIPPLPPELEAFLQQGAPPVIFTPGSFMRGADRFFQESLRACERLGLRAVFLTPYREQLPSPLPASVAHYPYVALQRLAPRSLAMVHHGGIGTCAQGLRAGVPQLVTPHFFDQPGNAARLKTLAVADILLPQAFDGEAAAQALSGLLSSSSVRDSCAQAKAHFGNQNSIERVCDIAEQTGR